jgi:mono/diheme cytochrome c family protein
MCPVVRADGRDIFTTHCVICHQAKAQGVPGLYPPLADSIGNFVAIPAGRSYLIHVVSFGMTGAISVHGQSYNGLMQQWSQLKDEDIAEVLNYILTSFNSNLLPKDFSPFTADEVKKYRISAGALGSVHHEREDLMKAFAAMKH